MPTDPTTTPAAPAATVSFTADDALSIANSVGALVAALNPAAAGAVALITGGAQLLRNTVLPAVQHLQSHEISVVEQQTLLAESAAERARVGAPAAVNN